ncbi:MAG: hypothetical protein CMK64_05135 [Pseudoalteromonas sp.]|nr:hypothetical protein [Pseudoalteromonas sp.]|tara:strand:- start:36639 stop:36929 length:291 start_codon:yes stop_codon:yes gene_type:complete
MSISQFTVLEHGHSVFPAINNLTELIDHISLVKFDDNTYQIRDTSLNCGRGDFTPRLPEPELCTFVIKNMSKYFFYFNEFKKNNGAVEFVRFWYGS